MVLGKVFNYSPLGKRVLLISLPTSHITPNAIYEKTKKNNTPSYDMSWNAYVDSILEYGTGHCDKGCIITTEGALCTTSAHPNNLNLSPEESAAIAREMKTLHETGNLPTFGATGIVAAGVKYNFLKKEEQVGLY